MKIRITAKRNGFNRCGISHPDTPVDYAAGHFTADQLDVLKAEPQLIVQFLPDTAAVIADAVNDERARFEALFAGRLAQEKATLAAEFDQKLASEVAKYDQLKAQFDQLSDYLSADSVATDTTAGAISDTPTKPSKGK
ncbi:HI1506-related protein [Limnobaculum xujianqingii]|nr:HI1506-related protein [Limnobaculum xujianqingii]